jgi:4-hydroxy-2-oxoheptanedioate aldolase
VARLDYDYICVDMQHGLIGYSDMVPMLQAITLGAATPTVRVPWNEPGIIGKVLDAGAMAVIVPMVNSAEEAAAALSRGRYAPEGARSSGPIRAAPVEGPEYNDEANVHTAIIPMVETVEAVDNLDGILHTPGVETIYVGPNDLSVSMGLGRDCVDPAFHDVLDHIVAKCEEHGVVPGIHCNPGNVRERITRGFRMVTVNSELTAMRSGLAGDLATARGSGESDSGDGSGY